MNSNNGGSGEELSRETFALVLAGGNGTRLGELTRWQCKPAVPFAGQYRNIDFTLSNCVNSGVRRIGVLTQYKAHSLIAHLVGGWSFLPRALGEFVEVWPAQQRLHTGWYAGTADAVFQNLDLVLAQRSRYTLVLAGDHMYKMDYRKLLAQHVASGASVTVACVPVPLESASAFGVLGVDERQRVQSFIEKPAPSTLPVSTSSTVLASMGIYVFTTEHLVQLLEHDASQLESTHDFGHDVLPHAVRANQVSAHLFLDDEGHPGYWRDVGTIDSYWQAHMELLAAKPPLDLYDTRWPIHTLAEALPPAKLAEDGSRRGSVVSSMIGGGAVVGCSTVTRSVLSTNVRVGDGSMLDEAIVLPNARIGADCKLRRVIVDSGVDVRDGTAIGWAQSGAHERVGSAPYVTLVTGDTTVAKDFRSVA
ncbi:MAG TPA: glucose-1-phosphate adenylyltransferase [Steroidobacteraceae bacterium]|nr:glucose-1-phosphate adenylyltransferase [Steroidobacteraceae bacterium]